MVAGGLAVVALAACGSDSDTGRPGPGERAADDEAAPSTTLDASPFCVTIRSLEALGSEPSATGGSVAEVLAQNASVSSLLDEAEASAPDDAPSDVQALFDDYRLVSEAILAAAGDTDAAYGTLTRDQPELLERLTQAGAHADAFAFFAERCGTAPPTSMG
jgi:hypothetical protein